MIPKFFAATFALMILALSPLQVWSEDAKVEPRPGKYLLYAYGAASSRLYLGHLILEMGGKYQVFLPGDKPAGDGTYEYDAAKKAIIWKSGPYFNDKLGGEFTVEREGKMHQIRLMRNMLATNSTDSKK